MVIEKLKAKVLNVLAEIDFEQDDWYNLIDVLEALTDQALAIEQVRDKHGEDLEQMRIRMGEMAAEIDRLNGEREPSPRITEQDAREIALAFVEYWIGDAEEGRLESFGNFMRDEGRALLNKLNVTGGAS